VVNIAQEYTDKLGSDRVVAMLEKLNMWPGIYFYLGSRVAFSQVSCFAWLSIHWLGYMLPKETSNKVSNGFVYMIYCIHNLSIVLSLNRGVYKQVWFTLVIVCLERIDCAMFWLVQLYRI
jgi:hypothetical protein